MNLAIDVTAWPIEVIEKLDKMPLHLFSALRGAVAIPHSDSDSSDSEQLANTFRQRVISRRRAVLGASPGVDAATKLVSVSRPNNGAAESSENDACRATKSDTSAQKPAFASFMASDKAVTTKNEKIQMKLNPVAFTSSKMKKVNANGKDLQMEPKAHEPPPDTLTDSGPNSKRELSMMNSCKSSEIPPDQHTCVSEDTRNDDVMATSAKQSEEIKLEPLEAQHRDLQKFEKPGSPESKKKSAFVAEALDEYLLKYGKESSDKRRKSTRARRSKSVYSPTDDIIGVSSICEDSTRVEAKTPTSRRQGAAKNAPSNTLGPTEPVDIDGFKFYMFNSQQDLKEHIIAATVARIASGKRPLVKPSAEGVKPRGWRRKFGSKEKIPVMFAGVRHKFMKCRKQIRGLKKACFDKLRLRTDFQLGEKHLLSALPTIKHPDYKYAHMKVPANRLAKAQHVTAPMMHKVLKSLCKVHNSEKIACRSQSQSAKSQNSTVSPHVAAESDTSQLNNSFELGECNFDVKYFIIRHWCTLIKF